MLIAGANLAGRSLFHISFGRLYGKLPASEETSACSPGHCLPIVWTLLYLLMSISAWLIYETRQRGKHNALKFYVGQLAVNLLWPLLFFGMKLYLFSFLWLLFLLLLVILMILRFYQLSAAAALLQIPYVLWLIFAGYLNFSFYLLNR